MMKGEENNQYPLKNGKKSKEIRKCRKKMRNHRKKEEKIKKCV